MQNLLGDTKFIQKLVNYSLTKSYNFTPDYGKYGFTKSLAADEIGKFCCYCKKSNKA